MNSRNNRLDLSKNVTHLIKNQHSNPIDILSKISIDGYLKGSSRAILGEALVICFTEAPINEFTKENKHFSHFGISIDKKYLFSLGGRPVIYQSIAENKYIDHNLHWKIVKYDPISSTEDGWSDWSWQREWRIPCERLYLTPENCVFIVPSEIHRNYLLENFQAEEEGRALFEELCLGLYPNPIRYFPYEIEVTSSTA